MKIYDRAQPFDSSYRQHYFLHSDSDRFPTASIHSLPLTFWMGDQVCPRVWHSAPNGITVDSIRESRNALEHGLVVLLADTDHYVALNYNKTKQRKANRNGSVIHADVLAASDQSLKEKVMRDQAVFFSKTPRIPE